MEIRTSNNSYIGVWESNDINDTMDAIVCVADETMSAQVVVARNAIAYADALLQELKGE